MWTGGNGEIASVGVCGSNCIERGHAQYLEVELTVEEERMLDAAGDRMDVEAGIDALFCDMPAPGWEGRKKW